jgi:hypothetical protein
VVKSVYTDLIAVFNQIDFKEIDKEKLTAIREWLKVNAASTEELAPSLATLLGKLEEEGS